MADGWHSAQHCRNGAYPNANPHEHANANSDTDTGDPDSDPNSVNSRALPGPAFYAPLCCGSSTLCPG